MINIFQILYLIAVCLIAFIPVYFIIRISFVETIRNNIFQHYPNKKADLISYEFMLYYYWYDWNTTMEHWLFYKK